MKIVHNFHRFFPEACGGIQIHLSELMPHLKLEGVFSKVAAAIEGQQAQAYAYHDVDVYRYPTFPEPPLEPNHGAFKHGRFHLFYEWLMQEKPDVYHQHQWTRRCGLEHLKIAKQLNIKTVVTLHLPEAICLRRTLMFEGKTACNGRITVSKCSKCVDTYSQKLPNPMLSLLGQLPTSVINQLSLPDVSYLGHPVQSKKAALTRPLVMPSYVNERLRSLRQLSKFSDRIIVVCDWLKQALLVNGIPEQKIGLCKYGIELPNILQDKPKSGRSKAAALKIAFLGRWYKTKGLHILVEAMNLISPDISIKLYIHAIPQDESYQQKMTQLIQTNQRIRIERQIPRSELQSTLAQYDVLAVPSQWLETGPLVVLEAHSIGIPVVGSNLGGIAERVRNNVDGILVEANNPHAWANAFTQLACDPSFLEKLKQGIQPVRTISREARELAQMYRQL